ncbi:MAG: hypothetical protein ACYC6Y_19250, partial [Thermoguttaceae bacterium]
WYRIAPPAGEFRWIFGRMVDPDYKNSGVRESEGVTSPLVLPPRPPARPDTAGNTDPEEPARLSDLLEPNDTARAGDVAVIEPPVLDLSAENLGQAVEEAPSERRQARWIAADDDSTDPPAPQPSRAEKPAAHEEPVDDAGQTKASPAGNVREGTGYISPGIPELNTAEQQPESAPATAKPAATPFAKTLERLEFELAQMLAEEPTVWSFTELEIQAQSLLERAGTAVERGKVRLLLKKIAQSVDVQERYAKFVDSEIQHDRREKQLDELRTESVPDGSKDSPAAGQVAQQYDGYGRLGRVVSSERDAPRYALVDEKGKVACFVTPAPGLNLDSYVGTKIGIVGTTGFIPRRQARHITAKHITPLDTVLR